MSPLLGGGMELALAWERYSLHSLCDAPSEATARWRTDERDAEFIGGSVALREQMRALERSCAAAARRRDGG